MVDQEFIRKTFTLTALEIEMLEWIIKRRHPRGVRKESETVRELIAEEYERMREQEQKRG